MILKSLSVDILQQYLYGYFKLKSLTCTSSFLFIIWNEDLKSLL